MGNDFSKFKKERKEFKEGKRIDITEMGHETIEFCILEEGYKPKEKEIREMAIEIKNLKGMILLYDQLCDELEEESCKKICQFCGHLSRVECQCEEGMKGYKDFNKTSENIGEKKND